MSEILEWAKKERQRCVNLWESMTPPGTEVPAESMAVRLLDALIAREEALLKLRSDGTAVDDETRNLLLNAKQFYATIARALAVDPRPKT